MKYIGQFGVILSVCWIGEVLSRWIPLPIPASIYGLLLMLAGLLCGVLKIEHVRETGRFLIAVMPVMFLPAAAGLLRSWSVLGPVLLPVLTITVVSTIVVMGVTGRFTQWIIRRGRREAKRNG